MATGCPLTALPHPTVLPQAHLCNPHPPYSTTRLPNHPAARLWRGGGVERIHSSGHFHPWGPGSALHPHPLQPPWRVPLTLPAPFWCTLKEFLLQQTPPWSPRKQVGSPISDSGSYPQTFKMSLWVPMTSREEEGDPRHKWHKEPYLQPVF